MSKKETGKSVYDIGVEIADEIGDDDLKESLRQLRAHQSLQVARAESVLRELTSGLPDQSHDGDSDPFDASRNRINLVIRENLDADSIYEFLSLCGVRMADLRASYRGHFRAEKLHSKPGGSRDKRSQIVAIWATGKYTTRSRCAEEECAELGMSYDAARKALRNIPEPPSRRTA